VGLEILDEKEGEGCGASVLIVIISMCCVEAYHLFHGALTLKYYHMPITV